MYTINPAQVDTSMTRWGWPMRRKFKLCKGQHSPGHAASQMTANKRVHNASEHVRDAPRTRFA